MPSSRSILIRGLTVSQFFKFIPHSWKQPRRPISKPQYESFPATLFRSFRYCIAHGRFYEAFRAFSLLRHQSCSHEFVFRSAVSLLSTCVEFNEFVSGQQIHAYCISSGLEFDPVLVLKLVTFYSAFNLLDEAQTITENSDIFHPFPWNVLIDSYVRNKRFEESVSVYKRMMSKGVRPDEFTYPSVLKACGALLDFASGRVVHGSIEVSSHRCSLYVCNALISMYKRFGKVDIARRLFERMSERDAVSWNAVINCYASEGNLEEALELFERMLQSGVEATVVTWNTLAGGCLKIGNYVGALNCVLEMRNYNVGLDSVAMINGLKACSHIGELRLGKVFHCLAVSSGFHKIDNVRNSLITLYSRCGDLRHAFLVFQEIEVNSLSRWNSIISCYAHNMRSEETSFLLREMLRSGFHPNYVTLASILPLCARVANLQHGKEIHCYILRRQSFNDCLILWNSLFDMYVKSGEVIAAKRVYDSMSKRDEVTYTSLIGGYGMIGKGEVALSLFKEMIRSGMKPDHVTMVAVLSACSHCNLVRQGQTWFGKMQSVFGIHPRLEHYSCMVDLYCRAGHLAAARKIFLNIPYEPSSAMCATILKACLIHGNTDIGEWAADKLLLEIKPEHLGHYMLLADMYAATGSWNKLATVKTSLSDMCLQKAHEFALMETDSGLDGVNDKPMIDSAVNHEQSSDEERLVEVG
ncbi:PREDICTED: pentatricopeptide repeat-containing protein At1g22830-like [Camelina sativa]|uniref:Pentatricopeptide repeat-containing protein At1g22830-like n=1 Tax=Camelina sativa TaxID=90675 RepID=A0ABM0WXG4_CAMSA|nr:PREDICTED: pentatricopeptide repeat-containing protein At1g22830-like [Camelina sativa]XP_010477554.1 PREDICTED: pentatricopeptide repeat-containing protein At1g22830-like [Camelina sativa]